MDKVVFKQNAMTHKADEGFYSFIFLYFMFYFNYLFLLVVLML